MLRFPLGVVLAALISATLNGQGDTPTVYITPTGDGFETFITAAIHKKKAPIAVVTDKDSATYVLTASAIEIEKVTTGAKVVSCLFAYCAGSEDKASTSVQLVDQAGVIRWSYAVNKGRGAKNRQSMAEAIAKHLKDDFLKKR